MHPLPRTIFGWRQRNLISYTRKYRTSCSILSRQTLNHNCFSAGRFVPQTLKTPDDSILAFTEGEKPIRNTDIALWLTWGVTHVTR